MSDPSAKKRCPSCGTEIPPGAPEGLCPRCILEGVARETAETEEATRLAAEHGMQTPSLEEIAEAFPQFEVVELIGSGGMGAVFKVKQPRLDRVVALKVLPRSLASDERFTERFTREARALAKLNHPNIVAVHDFGESGGFHYLLMEFVDGANLREAMQAGKFTPEQAFAVVPEICAALQYAHDEGVLHRDIKPENLLLDTKGRVKIVDFGIAKLVGQGAAVAPLTRTIAPGTPQYMAPEQIEQPAAVDHRADIYSLGVVFYEMLTGELPIGRFAAPSEKAKVGGQVDDIVFRTLQKEPERRQQSASEVKTQVEGLEHDAPPPPPAPAAPAVPTGSRTVSSRRGLRAVLLLLAAVVLFLLAWAGVLILSQQARFAERQAAQQLEERMDSLRAEARDFEKMARAAREDRRPATVIAELENKESAAKARLAAVQAERRNLRDDNQSSGVMHVALLVFSLVCVVCGVLAIMATAWGWKSLRELRLSGEHRGRASALVAALLIPMLVLSALIFVIVVLPASGAWSGPAISLAIIGILAANTWLVLSVRRWLSSPPSGEELRASQVRMAAQHPDAPPARSGIGWAVALIAIFLLGPFVLIAGCGLVVALAYWDHARVEGQDLTAEVRAATENSRRIAADETTGDLSTRERELVGSWHYHDGPDAGIFEYDANRTWRLQSLTGGFEASGTWRITDMVLENAITESNEEDQVGITIRSDILKLEDDVMLEISEQGAEGSLVLRPIADLSELEWSLVGSWWSLEKGENERFTFHPDRSFEVRTPGGTDRGHWKIDEVKKVFEMTIEESPKKFHQGLVVQGGITELDETTFIFANSAGGGLVTLTRDGKQQTPSP